jgi:hypothetical protein
MTRELKTRTMRGDEKLALAKKTDAETASTVLDEVLAP